MLKRSLNGNRHSVVVADTLVVKPTVDKGAATSTGHKVMSVVGINILTTLDTLDSPLD